MTIQEVFAKAENGTLTWEQFQTLAGTAKFADLSEGNYVSRQKYEDEIGQRDTQITTLNQTIETRNSDLTNLQNTLKDAGDIDAMKKAVTDLAELQQTYAKETKAYQRQLKQQAYEFAVKEYANNLEFTSPAAKRDFVSQMIAKNLTMDGDTIIGATDFEKVYRQDNAKSFVEEAPPAPANPFPTFVQPTTPQQPAKPTLSQLMQMQNANPDVPINF